MAAQTDGGEPMEAMPTPTDPAPTDALAWLADELVPALSATLGATGLAEIELRRPGWRVRVRRGADEGTARDAASPADNPQRRRTADRGRGHSGAARSGDPRDARDPRDLRDDRDLANGSGPDHGRDEGRSTRAAGRADEFRSIATSPAVGPFRPGRELRPGNRVRAGDGLGDVDVLGVRHEVTAPVDGIVMAVLVAPDDAVEYGQPLVELERATGQPAPIGADASGEDRHGSGGRAAGEG